MEEFPTLFLGRWHPLFVHLPIGMLIMAFFLALLNQKKAGSPLAPAVAVTLLFGAASAVLASVSGYLLSLGGGYDTKTLSLHQWLGISVAITSIFTWLLYRRPSDHPGRLRPLRKFRFLFLSVMTALLGLAGHFGGTLTHGPDYLIEALPERTRRLMGWQPKQLVIENVQEAFVYASIIQPILKQRCESCHGTKKKEGELALHTLDMLLQGGESGQVVVPGKVSESELYRRLTLPEGDDDRMPPKGRTPISSDQIRLIAWWIGVGAPGDKQVKDLEQPEDIQPILLALEGGEIEGMMLADIPPADAEAVQKLRAKGLKVIPLAEAKNQLMVSAVNHPEFTDQDMELLTAIGENVIQLKLGNTRITDNAMQKIGQLPELQRLHVENTAVGDIGLTKLRACKRLTYLNLVNTKVTDQGLAALRELPALERIYLYRTATSPQGLSALSRANPKLAIDTGNYQLAVVPADTIVY